MSVENAWRCWIIYSEKVFVSSLWLDKVSKWSMRDSELLRHLALSFGVIHDNYDTGYSRVQLTMW